MSHFAGGREATPSLHARARPTWADPAPRLSNGRCWLSGRGVGRAGSGDIVSVVDGREMPTVFSFGSARYFLRYPTRQSRPGSPERRSANRRRFQAVANGIKRTFHPPGPWRLHLFLSRFAGRRPRSLRASDRCREMAACDELGHLPAAGKVRCAGLACVGSAVSPGLLANAMLDNATSRRTTWERNGDARDRRKSSHVCVGALG
jgi:hypothetical protein